MDPICSSNPLPCVRMCGRAARLTRTTLKTLVSNCWRTCSRVKASSGPLYDTPALLTTTSRRPVVPRIASTACSTEASSVTSSLTMCKTSRSRSATWRRASAAGAFFPATSRIPANTLYPWRARVSTIRRPKPLLLPVTRMVCAIALHPFNCAPAGEPRCSAACSFPLAALQSPRIRSIRSTRGSLIAAPARFRDGTAWILYYDGVASALSRRCFGHRFGGRLDELHYVLPVGNHRHVARGDFHRGRPHALGEEPLGVGRDCLVVPSDEVPGREPFPGRNAHHITEGSAGERLLRGEHNPRLRRLHLGGARAEVVVFRQPVEAMLVDIEMRYRRRGRSLSQQRAEGLALVEAKGRDVDQADDIRRVCAQRTDDLASVGVAGDDGWPVLTSQHLTQARDVVS